MDWVRIFVTIVLGLGFNGYDVGTDVLNGKDFLAWQTKTYDNDSHEIGENCVISNSSEVVCQDLVWGILTLSCIQLPGVVMFITFFAAITVEKIRYPEYSGSKKYKTNGCKLLVLLVVPFPFIIWFQHIYSLFHFNPFMEQISAILLLGEGALESSPQLILQIYIVLSHKARTVSTIQWLAIIGSFITIAKTSIQMYASESGEWATLGHFFKHELTFDDSMLKEKSDRDNLCSILKWLPGFLTNPMLKVNILSKKSR